MSELNNSKETEWNEKSFWITSVATAIKEREVENNNLGGFYRQEVGGEPRDAGHRLFALLKMTQLLVESSMPSVKLPQAQRVLCYHFFDDGVSR